MPANRRRTIFPIQVMSTIIGGSFYSRLNMYLRKETLRVRVRRGIGFDMRVSAGPFSTATSVQTDKTSEAAEGILHRAERHSAARTTRELARARSYVALRFQPGFGTTGDISRKKTSRRRLVYHLPEDYFSKYVQNIEAVTAADVQRVAQKYIQPGRLAVVVAGDRKTIEPGIRALNLGAIKVMTIDEVFGPAPTITQ